MDSYQLLVSPSAKWTKILLTHGRDEVLKAILPPPSQMRHERAAIAFIEALSLWLDTALPVALSVDAKEAICCLGLSDELGMGVRSIFYAVEVIEPAGARRRRGIRIPGVGDFRDMRQLRLWCALRDSR